MVIFEVPTLSAFTWRNSDLSFLAPPLAVALEPFLFLGVRFSPYPESISIPDLVFF